MEYPNLEEKKPWIVLQNHEQIEKKAAKVIKNEIE